MQVVYRGDHVCDFMTLTNPEDVPITLLNVQIGVLCKEYAMPTFPLIVELFEDETAQLELGTNVVSVAIWDDCGKKTSPNSPRFVVKEKKVCGE